VARTDLACEWRVSECIHPDTFHKGMPVSIHAASLMHAMVFLRMPSAVFLTIRTSFKCLYCMYFVLLERVGEQVRFWASCEAQVEQPVFWSPLLTLQASRQGSQHYSSEKNISFGLINPAGYRAVFLVRACTSGSVDAGRTCTEVQVRQVTNSITATAKRQVRWAAGRK
jgi:hypothetical protein